MSDEMVLIPIDIETPHGPYHDMIYIPADVHEKMSPDDIAEEKRKRVNNWVSMMENMSKDIVNDIDQTV